MPNFQHLTTEQISAALAGAADRAVPVVVTCRQDDTWLTFYSRFVSMEGTHFLIELPSNDLGQQRRWAPADRIGLSFKYRHYKYVSSATLVSQETMVRDDGSETTVLRIVCPTSMHRLQRRVYKRASVPEGRLVRASFWRGGREFEPTGEDASSRVWVGEIDNLSAGGFHMACHDYTGPELTVGDEVGIHLMFGSEDEHCYADAMLRHVQERADGGLSLGFQFIGLSQSRHGRATLGMISAKVSEYLRLEEYAGRRQRQAS
jgi:hypothetical protein